MRRTTTQLMRLLLALPLALALLAAPRPSAAGVGQPMPLGPYSTWVFTGTCSDCEGTGVGTLVLSNYTPGAALAIGNFYSFSYASNLLTLYADYNNINAIDGILGPADGPAPVDFDIWNVSYSLNGGETAVGRFFFHSESTGPGTSSWFLGFPDADNGPDHNWALAPVVPEPGTLALLGAGLVGLGVARRRAGMFARRRAGK